MGAIPIANVAQDLNNAIYSLATLNPTNVLASNLNDAWQAWFSGARNVLPDASWWLAFKGFWAAYAAARSSVATLSERTPPASAINPTLWRTLLSDVQQRAALLGDGARAADQAMSDLAELARSTRNATFLVVGALAVGIVWTATKRRRL